MFYGIKTVGGGQYDHCRIFTASFDQCGSQRYTWCGISTARFCNDIFCRQHQYCAGLHSGFFIGYHKNIFCIKQREKLLNSIFQQGLLPIERNQRFGAFLGTQGPQSFAFAASHDDGENFIFVNFHNYFLLIPCKNFVCGSKRHLILSLCGK